MKRLSFVVLVIFLTHLGICQDYRKQFRETFDKNDTTELKAILQKWEKALPQDPEMFIAYFNYYARTSRNEMISFDQEPKKDDALVLTDSSNNKYYLNSSLNYNSELLQKGFDYIGRGIALHPTRLDMRFGKIYMLGEAENFPEFTKEIVKTIDYANEVKYVFLWKDGKPLDDPKKFFLDNMQGYIGTIYNTEDDKLLPLMRDISEAILKYEPGHVMSLANVGLTYVITGDNEKAITYFLKAEKVAPKDVIVLNNIAETYFRMKDKENAKLYYEKVIKYGEKEDAENARDRLSKLKSL